jgi:GTP cyclohydrolase III
VDRLAWEAEEKKAWEKAEREARAVLLRAAEEERCERTHVAAEKGKGKVSISHFDFDFDLGRC